MERGAADVAFDGGFDGMIRVVDEVGADGQGGFFPSSMINPAFDENMLQLHGFIKMQFDRAEQAHVMVGWFGIPVHKTHGEIPGLRRKNLHGENVFAGLQMALQHRS